MSEISENDLSLVLLDTDSRHVCAGLLIAGGWPHEMRGAIVHISPPMDHGMVYILGSMSGHQGSGVVHGELAYFLRRLLGPRCFTATVWWVFRV